MIVCSHFLWVAYRNCMKKNHKKQIAQIAGREKEKKYGKREHNEMIKVNESITVQLEQTIDILCTGLIVVGNIHCAHSCFDWQY